ncbi:MAG: phenylalanine--tRNA ligase subunit beta, partial [Actinomycetota bacterium]
AQDVCQVLGVDYVLERGDDPSFHPGRCAQVMVDGEPVAIAGELHPAVTEAWGLPPRSCALELDISRAIESSPEVRPAPDFSSHPIAKEDIALVVAGDVSARDVAASIERGAGELLESLSLFDVYEGDQVPDGHKSVAFALRFRAPDRTLSAEELAGIRESIVQSTSADVGARLR